MKRGGKVTHYSLKNSLLMQKSDSADARNPATPSTKPYSGDTAPAHTPQVAVQTV